MKQVYCDFCGKRLDITDENSYEIRVSTIDHEAITFYSCKKKECLEALKSNV